MNVLIHAYLESCGWRPTGHVTERRGKFNDHVTWWARGRWEYPQHLALSLERLGWVKILETMP